jgi:hypothetical protein
MKNPILNLAGRFPVASWLAVISAAALSGAVARAQTANPPVQNVPDAAQAAAKLKEKWHKALDEGRREFLKNNDRESAEFATEILDSLEKPGGMSPDALTLQGTRMERRVRELVRAGALESAATLNWELWQARNEPGPGKTGPAGAQSPTGSRSAPGPGGLVLYLPFDAPPINGVVRDESGAGNHGRVYGATWAPEGRFGGAYRFQITNLNDRIVIPNSDSLNPEQVTVAAWIKSADSDGFWNRILDKDWRNGYCLSLGGDYRGKAPRGKLIWETSNGEVESDRSQGDDRWHHVATTFDGKAMKVYVDGAEKVKPLKNPKPLHKNNWDVCIGNSVVDYGTGEFLAFDGLIDEVRVYNRALTAAEVKALATATNAAIEIPTPAAPSDSKTPAADRLKQLKQFLDQGLINKEQYDQKVKEIMDSL